MAAAISIFLITVGAILHFAVTKTVTGISLDTVGVILIIVGAGGLVISLFTMASERVRQNRTLVVRSATTVPTVVSER
jgi:hypothetical protein